MEKKMQDSADTLNTKRYDGNIKVSIIVPIYNSQKYLYQCLDSITKQTLIDIEIICVNDGSCDESIDILKRFQQEDDRITIIDKENTGYGDSMNIGISHACGEYIGIVESDDYILPSMYKRLYEYAKKYDLDFIKSDFYRFMGEDKNIQVEYNRIALDEENYYKVINPKEDKNTFRFIMNTWSGIYKRSFLEKYDIKHNTTPGASYQDNGFWFKTNIHASRTMYIDEASYMNRRDNPDSSVHNQEKVYAANREYELIYNYLEDNGIKEDYLDVYNLKRLHNYMFTLERIHPSYRHEYILAISEEFRKSRKMGELDSSFYSMKNSNEINWIIRDADEYYYEVWMNKYKVSVILPVYNAELYLRKCLDSLINQSLHDIEIICVDDGSSDNSLEILKKYQGRDKRIKVLHQENMGAGVARNNAMKIASGEYLSFLDSDDFFEKDMLKEAYLKSKETDADICIYEAYFYDNVTHKRSHCNFNILKDDLPNRTVFNRQDFKSNIFKSIMGWPWDKLFKRSFIENNHLRFQALRTTNDMYFVYSAIIKADKITILEKELYNQRRNLSTSLSSTRELSWNCFYEGLISVKNELIDMNIYEEYKRDFVNYALISCLWNFNSMKEPYARYVFENLRRKWFSALDILGHDEDYFDDEEDYRQLQDLLDIELDSYESYYEYQYNYWNKKNSFDNIYKNLTVNISENETMTVDELVKKLKWHRRELKKVKTI